MPLRAFRDGVAIGTVRPASEPTKRMPPMLARVIELEADDRGAWDREGARYELEDGRGRRLVVAPQPGVMLTYDRDRVRANLTVLYDGLVEFDWPNLGAGGG